MAKKSQWLRRIVVLLILGAGIFGGVYFWQKKDGGKKYQTTTVTRRDLRQTVTATGQLNPLVNVQVGCQISGTLLKYFADFNSPVKAGQIIAELDPALYKASLAQAEGNLANARAQLKLAELNARRKSELMGKKMVAQADNDQAVAQLEQAQAAVKTNEAARDKAAVDLGHCTIKSPIDGMVISRNIDVGQTVAASLNAPTLFVIANDLTKMQIDSNVAEADVGGIVEGQQVDFTVDAYPGQIFKGEVAQVRNAATTVQNVVTYDCVIKVANDELKLKPGMTASVSIILNERKGVLAVANAALRFTPTEELENINPAEMKPEATPPPQKRGRHIRNNQDVPKAAYRLLNPDGDREKGEAGTLDRVEIKAGINDGIFTEVVSGLNEGDHVVTAELGLQAAGAAPAANPFGGGMRFR